MPFDGTHRLMVKRKKICVALSAVTLMLLCAGVFAFFKYQHTTDVRPQNLYAGNLSLKACTSDKDSDDTPDDKDILDNALKYISTHPKYKSKYYKGGYPTDNYGVCTDVVAFALRGAGFDLRQLVNDDIKTNATAYNIEAPDIDIDFRRVDNLLVYFKNHAQNLPCDTSQISDWQAGDIVVFKDHVGIVSDRRNKSGVPYIIHHEGAWQSAYEQDVLSKRDDIAGHFRVW